MDTAPDTELSALHYRFGRLKQAFSYANVPSVRQRQAALRRLADAIRRHERAIVDAAMQDFSPRAPTETRMAEIAVTIGGIDRFIRGLPRLARRKDVTDVFSTVPGRSFLTPRPKGVVGIISPWNYPFQLAMLPAVAAIAAGNRVLIKPSEMTPATSALLEKIIADVFSEDEVAVVLGGQEVGEAFSSLPFDHLFFTGSTKVGRLVAAAAAQNLTPVTLELGGKSPCVILDDADLEQAAEMIAWGKAFNAGQTCVAPDYVLLPRQRRGAFVEAMKVAVNRQHPHGFDSEDYTALINARHAERMGALLDDARGHGATVVSLGPQATLSRKMAPVLILDPADKSRVLKEEIFGPLLPVITFDAVPEAIARINSGDRPLALYVFGADSAGATQVIDQTVAGGVARHSTLMHYAVEHLPFGGIGASGYGAYHGDYGFFEFSHRQPVFSPPRWRAYAKMITPPYSGLVTFLTQHTIGRRPKT